MGGHVACIGEIRNAYKILVRKYEGRPLLRHGFKCEDNIKMYFIEIWYEDTNWIHLSQVGISSEYRNMLSGPIRKWIFLISKIAVSFSKSMKLV
jgi:hypothetical protein